MALFNLGKLGNYIIFMKCNNCDKQCEIKVKKGIPVSVYVKNKQVTCDNCGCIIDSKEYETNYSLNQDQAAKIIEREDKLNTRRW